MSKPAIDYSYWAGKSDEGSELDDTWYGEKLFMPEDADSAYKETKLALAEGPRVKLPKVPSILPSKFTEGVFMMPKEDGTGYAPFSFDGRRHMTRIYDTPGKKVLLMCGRQVEKSTMLGNVMLSSLVLVVGLRALYVSPSSTQTKTFSNDRIKEPIETSPLLRRFTTSMLSKNIFEKQFINRSTVTLRYAYLNADRTRGIPAWQLFLDEIQDILRDNIPVIEHCLSHAPDLWKRQVYSGTPKSLDNVIEEYRGQKSTQGEWVVPCEGCNHWNVLGEKNIGGKGPICERCGKSINPQSPRARWAWMVRPDPHDRNKVPWESYRIPQLMVPWKIRNWHEVIYDYENHSRAKFFNECLGISFESGLRPITQSQLREVCGEHRMNEVEKFRNLSHAQPFFMGIDWGTGDLGFTVVTIGTYHHERFRILYMHRFVGEEAEPGVQIAMIIKLARHFNVALIGCDYGFGFGMNHHLIREFGPRRVHQFQYLGDSKRKLFYDVEMRRWKAHRSEVMSAMFEAIKKKKCEFPHWDDFHEPFSRDFTNIFSEYSERTRMIKYDHSPGNPDDSFHSFTYCWLVSMLLIRRGDIISPGKEDEAGAPIYEWDGTTTDQG